MILFNKGYMKSRIFFNSSNKGHIIRCLLFLLVISFPVNLFASVSYSTEKEMLAQQKNTITGLVVDAETGEELIGVSVEALKTKAVTITDVNGRYSIVVNTTDETLKFSYIGYTSQEIPVKGKTEVTVRLAPAVELLDEVMVIGYSVQKKKLVTGATIQIKGDEMQKLSTVNPVSAMQSMSPGISITQKNGLPDAGYKMYIRGIGTVGNSSPLVIIDGTIGGDLNALNPSDIESIDVLKDAASSAIYGARAANGVIIVTTKQGKVGKPRISYDGYYGIQNVQKMMHTTDALTYVSLLNETLAYDGLPPYDYASLVPNWSDIESGKFEGTDWLEEFRVKDAPIQNHSFNVTGGTEQSLYSLGFSYTSQDGIFGRPINPGYDRYTARINTEYILYKKNGLDIIKFGENVLFNHRVKNGQYDRTGNPWDNDFSNMFHAPPFLPVKDAEGNYSSATSWYTFYPNPIGFYVNNTGEKTQNNTTLMANAYLTIQPIKNLFLKSAYTYNYNHSSNRAYYPSYNLGGNMSRTDNSVAQEQGYSNGYILENTIN